MGSIPHWWCRLCSTPSVGWRACQPDGAIACKNSTVIDVVLAMKGVLRRFVFTS